MAGKRVRGDGFGACGVGGDARLRPGGQALGDGGGGV
jgi:hypothetical protein